MSSTIHGMFRCLPYEAPITVKIDPHDHQQLLQQPQVKNIINITSSNTNCELDNNGLNITTDDNNQYNAINTDNCIEGLDHIDTTDCNNINHIEGLDNIQGLSNNDNEHITIQGLEYIQTEVKNLIKETENIQEIIQDNIQETNNIQDNIL